MLAKMLKKTKLTVVVPCYNEAKAVPEFLNEAREVLLEFGNQFPEQNLSFLFVNNNSSDQSENIIKSETLKESSSFQLIDCTVQGYGAALKFGFEEAQKSSEIVGFLDLDNTYPLFSLIPMLKKLEEQSLDIVYGVRLHKNSKIEVIRHLGNFLYVLCLKLLTGTALTDACSGMRLFRSNRVSEVVKLRRNDLSFSIEFTAFAIVNKWKIGEVPIHYRDRIGTSKLSVLSDGFKFLWTIFDVILRRKNK